MHVFPGKTTGLEQWAAWSSIRVRGNRAGLA